MFQRKDNKLWVERVIINGKVIEVTGKTQKILNQKLTEIREKAKKGLTVSDALDLWLKEKEKTVQYKTYEGYQSPIKRIKEVFGDDDVRDVIPSQVQAFINSLAAKGYKRTTVQRPLDVMRMLYDFLITSDHADMNPTTGVRLPRGLQQDSRDLAPREAINIVKANIKHPFGLYAYFVLYTGMRDQEALAIMDTDIHDTCISVNKAISWQPNKPVIKTTKTVNGIRNVVLLSPLKDALPKKFKGYLFSADGGKSPLTQTEFRRRWNKYCRDVGLATPEIQTHKGKNGHTYSRTVWHNTIVPYQLRHEFATICFDADLDPADTADLMGHSSEQITRKWYTHIQNQRRDKSSKKLEDFISKVY